MPATASWEHFRLAKAIFDARSLVGAARQLGVNHSTIFRRLGALEEALGTRLFERSRGGYEPTAAGEEMVRLASRMDQDIVDFERKIAGRDVKPSGELRIATNDALLVHLLTPVLASFRVAFPDIRLDVAVGNSAANLSRRDADIAIRATMEPAETLVGRRIARFGWARYVARRRPATMADEDTGPWVGFSDSLAHITAARWLGANVAARQIIYRVDTVLGMAEAVAAGLGHGILPCFIGDHAPALVRLGPQLSGDAGESLWLLTHPDMRHSARVRAFMDHAGAELARLKKRVEGE